MIDNDQSRQETLVRLAQSRAEIRRLLEPPPRPAAGENGAEAAAEEAGGPFPRSRTMRLLMSGRGMGTLGALVGGLLLARPAFAFRLLRLVPVEAVARVLLVKAIAAMRAKSE